MHLVRNNVNAVWCCLLSSECAARGSREVFPSHLWWLGYFFSERVYSVSTTLCGSFLHFGCSRVYTGHRNAMHTKSSHVNPQQENDVSRPETLLLNKDNTERPQTHTRHCCRASPPVMIRRRSGLGLRCGSARQAAARPTHGVDA